MQADAANRYEIRVIEGPPRGDLYELEQSTTFEVVDRRTGQLMLHLRGEMSASLSRETGLWDDYSYTGVREVALSEDQQSVLVKYYDGEEKQFDLPTIQQIDELLGFLPKLYASGFEPVAWGSLEKTVDGAVVLPHPNYHPDVLEFIKAASKEVWSDFNYVPREAWEMLQDPELVARASFSQLKTMLTYCVRGERFSDGHWAAMIEQGHIRRLLERLSAFRPSID